jgi:capsular exopolysaccharide synthesis family protein
VDLLTYLHVIQYRKYLIILVALFAVAGVAIGRTQMPVKYESSAILRVVPYSTSNPSNTQLNYADRIMKTYVEIGSSSVIMSDLRSDLGLPSDRPTAVDIEIVPDTELLRVTVADYDPVLAKEVATALVGYLINDNSIRDVRVSLMEPASIPEPPSTLSIIAIYLLAFLVGGLGGLALAFLFENIDPRLYDERQMERVAQLPVLGSVPSVSVWQTKKVVARRFPFNHVFHRLGIKLQSKIQGRKLHSVMITSPSPREGKSTVAASLAFSLAKSGYKTILIDMDMYRPTIHRYFGLRNEQGLSDILLSNAPAENIIKETKLPGLSVITNGILPNDSEEFLLHGKRVKELLGQLERQYDYAILDTPAFLGVAESVILSTLVDGVLLVTRLGMTQQALLADTCQQLSMAQAKVIGLVISSSNDSSSTNQYLYYRPRKRWARFFTLLKSKPLVESMIARKIPLMLNRRNQTTKLRSE